jgi:D-glycero-D-manno-heptose 1,7-bisphosphate phosphatase
MLRALIAALGADTARSWMIGDSVADVQAGIAAKVKTGLVFSPNRCELCPMRSGAPNPVPDAHGATLLELAEAIIQRG